MDFATKIIRKIYIYAVDLGSEKLSETAVSM